MARTTISIDDELIEEAKDTGLNVSQLAREAVENKLESPTHHFFNTNEDNLPGNQTGAGVYGHGVVATFAKADNDEHIDEFGGYIGEVEANDRIYSWENNYGLRAVGIALEDGNAKPVPEEHRLFHPPSGDIHEFHVPVNWVAVLDRKTTLTTDEVKHIVGHPVWGRGTHVELKDEHHPELLWDIVVGRS